MIRPMKRLIVASLFLLSLVASTSGTARFIEPEPVCPPACGSNTGN